MRRKMIIEVIKTIFKSPKSIFKIIKAPFMSAKQVALETYEDKKRERPNKTEKSYLRHTLLTTPPFDYQFDELIDGILERYKTIEELSDFIKDAIKVNSLWENRAKNIKTHRKELEDRNGHFLWRFYNVSE